ncbi:MAG: hypothetical protein O7C01_05015 [Actinobacteria bacterium]|nr:hypothetical protein [Actinomycetota bacterium]
MFDVVLAPTVSGLWWVVGWVIPLWMTYPRDEVRATTIGLAVVESG